MYQFIGTILVILTILVCVTKPQLHKTVFVYDSNYTVVEEKEIPTETKNLPTMVVNAQKEEKTYPKTEKSVTTQNVPVKVQQPKVEQKINTNVQPQVVKQENISTPVQTVKTTQTPNPLLNVLTQKEITPKPEIKTEKVEEKKEPVKVIEKTVEPVKQSVQTVSQAEKERQELILWNVWRSNLQNKIMQDTKLPIIPEGIIFRFQFDVDKYGKISNVQTWSLTPAYTPYAIQYIAPVIRSYQGREILNFPEGSNRISTTVEGGWKISKTAKFSTPSDYKDSEKVISK